MKYFLLALQNYSDFKGRTTRKEYWYFFLFNLIFQYAIMGLGYIVGDQVTGAIPQLIYAFVMFVPALAAGVRRMHDAGKSGWFMLVPIYNLVLALTPSQPFVNKWGAPQST